MQTMGGTVIAVLFVIFVAIGYFINQRDIKKLEEKLKEQQKEIEKLKKVVKQK